MSRSALAAAAATVIATTLVTVGTASAGAPPKSLTHQFPLGTQTLSHTATTARTTSTTAPRHSATAPASPPATQNRHAAAPAAPRTHSGHHSVPDWILIALVVVVLVGVFVDWLVVRKSPRSNPRPALRYEYETNQDSANGIPSPTGPPRRTPDPFEPPSARTGRRHRQRRDDRTTATHEEYEPPPLDIHRQHDT
jgi:hypothetical protein